MPKTSFVKWPKYEEYKEMFKEHFIMEKRDDGVLLVRMHTNGGPQLWSMELHRAIGQMWRIVGSDSDIELVIFTGTGKDWIIEFEPESWEQVIKVNLTAVFLLSQEFCRYRKNLGKGGKIINIGSLQCKAARPTTFLSLLLRTSQIPVTSKQMSIPLKNVMESNFPFFIRNY